MSIEYALKSHERELLSLPHVKSVGIGHVEDKDVILVFVDLTDPGSGEAASQAVPSTLEGYEVVIRPELQIGGSETASGK